ncbi:MULTISPECIES: 2OG-Fe(II) oxygenase [Commensalibacter]|uniref:2OG-Fe(II) oxygenase n=1 Tax=Commensalibacter TaxID=1079922 RepID=UPI0012D96A1D|nr:MULTISPECIES: 2OG-Fe(II) oxygenase [Commensalibacter]MBI0066323.1 2OG-Fe(II) oxygenase [Commensalibacter sp. M0134]MBI0070206.1 2OG-Fe(II) oxygenase [Commensalibacter sp. M0133]MBI0081638.1 2OG-Fe(II) oxygenase [Commensalibacter melissae]MUH05360.1 2OG-Fe(II) oxygenase [Commensalibacter melissae]MUH07154.1 2OG-Fe(II) oxygenase [Commensalibacter melissae]
MQLVEEIKQTKQDIKNVIDHADYHSLPYSYWTMTNVLPSFICDSLLNWMPDSRSIAGDVKGKRENHNKDRVFVTQQKQREDPACAVLAQVFDSEEIRSAFSHLTGGDLSNTWLRLELCLDTDGFWLEPHTDIGAKKLTFLLSLSTAEGAEGWGTDIMNEEGQSLGRSSGVFNSAFLFIPAKNTWHGFEQRPIKGVRRTLILNYVDSSWRAKHELAFPS